MELKVKPCYIHQIKMLSEWELGPTLFTVFINDFLTRIQSMASHADGTHYLVISKSVQAAKTLAKNIYLHIKEWENKNKVSLNEIDSIV